MKSGPVGETEGKKEGNWIQFDVFYGLHLQPDPDS